MATHGAVPENSSFFDWAVASLGPSLSGLESTQRLTAGGSLGLFALYALSSSGGACKGFNPMALRREVLDRSGNAGLLVVTYG